MRFDSRWLGECKARLGNRLVEILTIKALAERSAFFFGHFAENRQSGTPKKSGAVRPKRAYGTPKRCRPLRPKGADPIQYRIEKYIIENTE